MNNERVIAFAERCERWSVSRPALYDFAVASFGLLGAAYPVILLSGTIVVIAALAVAIHGFAAAFFLKVVWILGIPLFAVVRAAFRKPEPVAGRRLVRDDAPDLFTRLDALRRTYRTPRLDGVFLVPDFRAAVMMRPRFGVFGGIEHNLILGLPALLALEMRHLEAVMAHEFGHMAQGRRSFDRFIYAIRSTVAIVFEARVPKWLHPLLEAFIAWWYPRFEISSLVVARRVEVEADGLSAATAGAKTAAEALVAFEVQDLRLSRDFWPAVERRAVSERTPPSDVMLKERALFETPLANGAPLLELALAATPAPADTHPVLGARLKALGVDAADAVGFLIAGEIEKKCSAAEELFGTSLDVLLRSLSDDWAANAAESWSTAWGTLYVQRRQLAKLDEEAADAALDESAARERALLAAQFYREDARALLEARAAAHPHDASVLLELGRLLLAKEEDVLGIELLERAARGDRATARVAVEVGANYLLPRRGRAETERFVRAIAAISGESCAKTAKTPP